jgi:DNA-binding NtrC family response regulator
MDPKKILIIDDEEAIRIFLADVFESNGYRVCVASNGAEGLALADQERFDAIVTDMVMPDMHGAEIISRLRRGGSDTPIVVITGYSEGEAILEAAREFFIDRVIFKPFAAGEICKAVEDAVQERKSKVARPCVSTNRNI